MYKIVSRIICGILFLSLVIDIPLLAKEVEPSNNSTIPYMDMEGDSRQDPEEGWEAKCPTEKQIRDNVNNAYPIELSKNVGIQTINASPNSEGIIVLAISAREEMPYGLWALYINDTIYGSLLMPYDGTLYEGTFSRFYCGGGIGDLIKPGYTYYYGIRPATEDKSTFSIRWGMTRDFDDGEGTGSFRIPEDANYFLHSRGNFGDNYWIDDAICRRALKKDLGWSYIKAMLQPWDGSCYGIAATMALNYSGLLYYDGGNYYHSYHYLLPQTDNMARDIINYYQLTQYKGSPIAKGYRKGIDNKEDLYAFFSSLIKALQSKSKNEVIMLSYGYMSESGSKGHTILATEVSHNEDGSFTIKLYDENTVDVDGMYGRFCDMYISEDLMKFHFQDGIGYMQGNDSASDTPLLYIQYLYPESLYRRYSPDRVSTNSIEEEGQNTKTHVSVEMNAGLKVQNEKGSQFCITEDGIEDNISLGDISFVSQDVVGGNGNLICTFPVDEGQKIIFDGLDETSDITVENENLYMNVTSENAESIVIDLEGTIKVEGQSTKTCASMVNSSMDKMLSVNSSARGDITFELTNERQIKVSAQQEASITEIASYDGDANSETKKVELEGKELTVDEEMIRDEEMQFSDVPLNVWFYDPVKYVYNHKIMTGLSEELFGPVNNLARAQFAVILHRMNGEPDIQYSDRFPDVISGDWYTNAVLWTNSIGVVTGYENTGMFGPGDNINREQMAVMMYRYAKYQGYDIGQKADFSKFQDASSVNDFAREAMQWAVGSGIITGKYNETILDPQGNANRAECATIIMRFMEMYS